MDASEFIPSVAWSGLLYTKPFEVISWTLIGQKLSQRNLKNYVI
jgi:hypothetical protein